MKIFDSMLITDTKAEKEARDLCGDSSPQSGENSISLTIEY